jgi:deoxyribodipyrimidine photo-lyase
MSRPVVVWFRRDLRVDDHAALYHAASTGVPVVPLFIFDDDVIDRLPSDGAVFDFQAEALRDLDSAIVGRGGRLICRRGAALEVHEAIIREFQPSALFYNRDYEPAARRRDEAVERLYRRYGIDVQSFRDHVIHEPTEVLTAEGKPYVVFTPFANAWKRLDHPAPFGRPKKFSTPAGVSVGVLGSAELDRRATIERPAMRGGLTAAEKQWRRFLEGPLQRYHQGRDLPAEAGTSRMSAYLRFGCISPRRLLEDASAIHREASSEVRTAVAKYVDELIWREFYQAVLYHFPQLVTDNYRPEFDRMPWSRSERTRKAWEEGRTGYPLVDAGIRELRTTGWMHNRVRMVVASFLTKDLMHDWRTGAAFFEQYLLDIDTASNVGGWQWSASTGVDPKPLRIFNPTLQAERYDPTGAYIRAHVPELARVPDAYIHAPWSMPPLVQREAGCVIGEEYPRPIIDHHEGSARFKAAYLELKRGL